MLKKVKLNILNFQNNFIILFNFFLDEKKKRFDKKIQKSENNTENKEEVKEKIINNDPSNQEDDESFPNKNKHPLFDRKTKIVGNDLFLKQIFS